MNALAIRYVEPDQDPLLRELDTGRHGVAGRQGVSILSTEPDPVVETEPAAPPPPPPPPPPAAPAGMADPPSGGGWTGGGADYMEISGQTSSSPPNGRLLVIGAALLVGAALVMGRR